MWKFWRRGRTVVAPKLTTREGSSARKVDLLELTPELLPYLGQAAYLQLTFFTMLTRAVETAATIERKDVLSDAAQTALEKYRGLAQLIRDNHASPAEVMQPFAPSIDNFQRQISGGDWAELVTSSYLVSGLLDDFFTRLGTGLPGPAGAHIQELLTRDSGRVELAGVLADAIAHDYQLAARLALWGRRLVGDTMLMARSALIHTGNLERDESRIEPVFSELIADHTRRMDVLGLTA